MSNEGIFDKVKDFLMGHPDQGLDRADTTQPAPGGPLPGADPDVTPTSPEVPSAPSSPEPGFAPGGPGSPPPMTSPDPGPMTTPETAPDTAGADRP